jgi:glutathione S-transferase
MTPFVPAVLLSAAVTLIALILTCLMAIYVHRVRVTHHVPPPAISGHPQVERAIRVHGNMTEAMVLFVPALWLATIYFAGWIPGIIGIIWLIGRTIYWPSYMGDPARRLPGFIIAQLCTLALIILAVIGVINAWLVV